MSGYVCRITLHSWRILALDDEKFFYTCKLDGVDPLITLLHRLAPPLNPKKETNNNRYIWHETCDMWHVTCDMWQVIYDTWREGNMPSKVQAPSSFGFGVKVFWRFGGKDDWLNKGMNHKDVQRTLLITYYKYHSKLFTGWLPHHT